MKVWQIFIGSALGILLFMGAFLAEENRYNILSRVKNPFQNAQSLNIVLNIQKEGGAKRTFTKEGEFFYFFPGTAADFTHGQRRITKGEVFISSHFIDEKDFQVSSLWRPEKAFRAEDQNPKTAQISVGPLMVSYPGGEIFIRRDRRSNVTRVYAIDHAIDIYFDGIKDPFVVPPHMYIAVREDLIDKNTAELYNTKLRKDLNLRSFGEIRRPVNQEARTAEAKMGMAMYSLDGQRKALVEYASLVPETWIDFPPNVPTGGFFRGLREIQSKLAIGYPDRKTDELAFQKMVTPFVYANYYVKKRKTKIAKRYIRQFEMVYNTRPWRQLLLTRPKYAIAWKTHMRAQKALLRTIFPTDPERVFVDFWFSRGAKDALGTLEQEFFKAENLIANGHPAEAKKELIKFKKRLVTLELAPELQPRVTRMRRVMTQLLHQTALSRDGDLFRAYTEILKKELSLFTPEQKELEEEIRLEAGQDLLKHLRRFLTEEPDTMIARTLVDTYLGLEINAIAKTRQREIFGQDELDVIQLMRLAGGAGGTNEEDFAKISKEWEQIKRIGFSTKLPKKNEKSRSAGGITDKKSLVDFLEEAKVDVRGIVVKSLQGGKFLRFENGRFSNAATSGTLEVGTQTFKIITIGARKRTRMTTRSVGPWLLRLERRGDLNKNHEADSMPKKKALEDAAPNQKTFHIIVGRKYVQQLFQEVDVTFKLRDVTALNNTPDKYAVENAVFGERYKASFIYLQEQDTMTNLKVLANRAPIDFGTREVPREDLMTTVEERIKEIEGGKAISTTRTR